jgi:hypothetical protein
VSGPSTALLGASTTLTYGIPLVLIGIALLIWLFGRFPRDPPYLRTVKPDRDWIKSPTDIVDAATRSGKLAAAISIVRQRVEETLLSRYGISLHAPPLFWRRDTSLPPAAVALLEAGRELKQAYTLAWQAETTPEGSFLSSWLIPQWQRRARTLFDAALTRIEPRFSAAAEAT